MLHESDKASLTEMRFAGQGLNLAGGLLLLGGMVSWLNLRSGGPQSGWTPCLAGLLLGLALTVLGDRCWRGALRPYAQPLLATGSALLLLTACAAHYQFGLLPAGGLLGAVTLLVVWGGVAVFRYDCRWLGHGMLAMLFLAPLFLELPGSGLVLYLIAINLGTTLLAWRKRYPVYLVGGFLGSYAMFLACYGFEHPILTLEFLTGTYALFLLSNHLFQTRDELSLIQPTAFALVSYMVLFLVPNWVAVTLYGSLTGIHLLLALSSRPLRARINLILALLFLNAAISFVPYFATDTRYYTLVTALWLAEAFLLLRFSGTVATGFSYLAMLLAGVQLCYVVPSMPPSLEQVGLSLISGAALLAYAVTLLGAAPRFGSDLVAGVALLTSVLHTAMLVLWQAGAPSLIALVGAALTLLLAVLAGRLTRASRELTALCVLMGAALAVAAWLVPLLWWARLGVTAVLALTAWRLRRAELELTSVVALGSFCLMLPLPEMLVFLSLVLALLHRLRRPVWHSLLEPLTELAALPVLFAGLFFLHGAALWALTLLWVFIPRKDRSVPLLLGMKASLVVGLGSPSTLLWCLAAVPLTFREPSAARLALSLACLKAIAVDGTLTLTGGQLSLLPWNGLGPVDFVSFLAVLGVYFGLSRRAYSLENRNELLVMGLTVFCFGSAGLLHSALGNLDEFQIILSAFWCASAFGFIVTGVHAELRVFRIFGLAILAAGTLKILCVDAGVLSAYSRVTTLMILGGLLMAVSFVYQQNRARLTEAT